MDLLNKLLAVTLLATIIATGCVAISLTQISASVTITFGHQKVDPKLAALSMAIPASALKRF